MTIETGEREQSGSVGDNAKLEVVTRTFEPPAVVLEGDDASPSQAVQSPTNVPVEENTGSVSSGNLEIQRQVSNAVGDEERWLLGAFASNSP